MSDRASPWTSPRAYIIRMSGVQTMQLHRAHAEQLKQLYCEYMADLIRRHGK